MAERAESQVRSSPDNTAVRVALWRALHVQVDAAPHVLEDLLGLELVAPDQHWRQRPDMHPGRTSRSRASIVARSRFIEDLATERVGRGLAQYVLLGAGLDTFAQRRVELLPRLRVYEIDQPATQAWKQGRLRAIGAPCPSELRFVPVDFESQRSWLSELRAAGFDLGQPALVASTGVAMYLSKEAVVQTLREIATLAPGSTLVMSFMLPFAQVEPEERAALEGAAHGARAAGTPFLSFFAPAEILSLAIEAGLKDAEYVSPSELYERYFTGRADGLRPSSAEGLLLAST